LQPEHTDFISLRGIGAIGTHRRLTKAGVLDVVPIHISQVDRAIRGGTIKCDVALIQLSPPNERGEYSPGLIGDYVRAMVESARMVIAEINAEVPWVNCDAPLTSDDIDFAIRTDRPLIQVPAAEVSALDEAIAGFVEPFIPDRATLQVGIGGVPEAIMKLLTDRKGLGIHSGLIGESVVDLIESGAVTNEYKEIDRGVTITGALLGTSRLYRFCERNPAIRLAPTSYTHNVSVLSRLSRLISINSALEVDITGQVNAEAIGATYLGAVGGQVDYVRAANISAGGRSIIALRATAQGGEISRIVPSLSGPVTTARADVDIIVTEFGAAELRGLSLRERIRAMAGIAAPQFREELEREAHRFVKA
jgi:acyl-CoA hydrolase